MAEVLVVYAATPTDVRGVEYTARACAREQQRGRWEVWFELEPVSGGPVVRTRVETTQQDRDAATRWACGISRVYLKGALARVSPVDDPVEPSRTVADAPEGPEEREAVLDPTEVIANGEEHLRGRLQALSIAHLRDIARAQRTLSTLALERATKGELIEAIVAQAQPTH